MLLLYAGCKSDAYERYMLYNAGITTGEVGRGICYCYMLVVK